MIDMEELVERLIVKNAELMSLREDFASVKALLKIESEANNRANDELTRAKDLVRRMADELGSARTGYCSPGIDDLLDEAEAMTKEGKP
jgi:predicted Ser/Thr protein kinase